MKVLVVRFSSIGDIVLTSPVLRALKDQINDVEIHYLTKKAFESIITPNPCVTKVFLIESSIDEQLDQLKKENYDQIIDLHNNIRTKSLKAKLSRPMTSFPKLNWKKWLLVKLKFDRMPEIHVVDRYFEAVKNLGVNNPKNGVEFFIDDKNKIDTSAAFGLEPKKFVTVAIGAQFGTKRIPNSKLEEILSNITLPIVLIGGKEDEVNASQLISKLNNKSIYSAAGKFNIQESASIVKQSLKLLTNDTGMMHIAAAFDVSIVSVWGNTVPQLGMYPYRPGDEKSFKIHQVKNLSCRPCSKIGYQECPKGHFKCMNEQDSENIAIDLNR